MAYAHAHRSKHIAVHPMEEFIGSVFSYTHSGNLVLEVF